MTILKMSQNLNCNMCQNLKNQNCDKNQEPKLWQNTKSKIG